MKILLFTFLIMFLAANNLPIKEWGQPSANPFVLYLSGDGGFNKFSNTLCDNIHGKGYAVGALNSKSYFWTKKTPQQTSSDLSVYLKQKLTVNNQFVLVGYSFGADVAPFVVNLLPADLKRRLKSVVLIAPSTTNDFEIHVTDMLGTGSKRGLPVIPEINKLAGYKTTIILSHDEKDFPLSLVKLPNYKALSLNGGHHFDDNVPAVAATVISAF